MKKRPGEDRESSTPANDPMVVTLKCTLIMLEKRMMEMALCQQWVNSVLRYCKTMWIVEQFNLARDTVVTSRTEAANELERGFRNELKN